MLYNLKIKKIISKSIFILFTFVRLGLLRQVLTLLPTLGQTHDVIKIAVQHVAVLFPQPPNCWG